VGFGLRQVLVASPLDHFWRLKQEIKFLVEFIKCDQEETHRRFGDRRY
jgi:hypothetical protein